MIDGRDILCSKTIYFTGTSKKNKKKKNPLIISAETCPTRRPASIGQARWHTQKAIPGDHDLQPVCQSGSSFN